MQSLLPSALLALLSGVLYFVGFVGFGQWYLTWICFVPVLIATREVTRKQLIGLGLLFGLTTHMGGYYWVIHLIHEFANLATPLAFLGYVLLCAYQGASLAVVLGVVSHGRKLHISPVVTLPLALAVVEWFYPFLFPSYVGNAFYEQVHVTQIVEIFGMPGLSVLVGLVNAAAFEVVESRLEKRALSPLRLAIPTGLLVAALGYGHVRINAVDQAIAAAPKIEVALIQTNLGAKDKHDRRDEFIRRHIEMSLETQATHPEVQLLVWPESAYNAAIPKRVTDVSRVVTPGLTKPVVFGAITADLENGRRRIFNTAILTSSAGIIRSTYDKIELLAFGETIPLVDSIPTLQKFFPYTGTFTRGQTLDHLRVDSPSATLLPMICYEDIIPELVRKIWAHSGPPNALVNITNDSWYGDTHEPLIHLALATFRTIETRRALIRSTNTGISALVDPVGRITQRTGQWTREVLTGQVPLITDGSTPLWIQLGPVVPWTSLVLLAAMFVRARRRLAQKV